ncbi:low temperature requirement protein A [Kutzneria buriramensis]|uniref:low temperature requirement protein A n=1 Tax=Kutzneria buriramensis TaxID=1045776 RepID=UPI0024828EA7|nr:low temperature requirement protein A [Kutzneria buriramensis]
MTSVLSHELDLAGLARMGLLLAVIWWMYGGYAWLTNAVPPRKTSTRGLLVLAMVAYVVLAISVPSAFEANRWAFAAAYLVIVLVHSGVFLTTAHPSNRQGTPRVLPWNLTVPLLTRPGTFDLRPSPKRNRHSVERHGLVLTRPGTFDLRPSPKRNRHSVERHGLVLIIAFGESVVAIGIGEAGLEVTPGLIVAAALPMVTLAGLWWGYFAGDSEKRAEATLTTAEPFRRTRLSLIGYGHCYLPLFGGIIVLAAGVKTAVAHPEDALSAPAALAVGGGMALYLVGDVLLRLGSNWTRCVAAVLAAASTVVGATESAVAQLAVLAAVVVLLVAAEHLARQPGGVPSSR